MNEFAAEIRELYGIAAKLEARYPGRRFTPDGHMVGSLGEVMAERLYGLDLYKPSHAVHDGMSPDGRLVQVKTTQGSRIALGERPEHLLVFKVDRDGKFEEVFNGPGEIAWALAGKVQKTGQRYVSLSALRHAMEGVPEDERLRRVAEGRAGDTDAFHCDSADLAFEPEDDCALLEELTAAWSLDLRDRRDYLEAVSRPGVGTMERLELINGAISADCKFIELVSAQASLLDEAWGKLAASALEDVAIGIGTASRMAVESFSAGKASPDSLD